MFKRHRLNAIYPDVLMLRLNYSKKKKSEEDEDSPWRGELGEHERLIKTKAALHSSISSPSNM